jgi:hypothetical protein
MTQEEAEAYAAFQREAAERSKLHMPPDIYENHINYDAKQAMDFTNRERQEIADLRNFLTDAVLALGENPDDYLAIEYFTTASFILRSMTGPNREYAIETIEAAQKLVIESLGDEATYIVMPRKDTHRMFILLRADEHAFRAKLAGTPLYKISECDCWVKLKKYF